MRHGLADPALMSDCGQCFTAERERAINYTARGIGLGRLVRCYLMRKGHIKAVEILSKGPDDALIEQGKAHFARRSDEEFDGFEIWDRKRWIYAYPEVPNSN